MPQKHSKSEKRRPGIKMKLILSLGSIAAVMLIACGITIFEYGRMNSYVSGAVERLAVCDTLCVRDTVALDSLRTVVTDKVIVSPVGVNSEQVLGELDHIYYRSLMPGIVAMGVGILLVAMLLYFLMAYYANPIYKMRAELGKYASYGTKYTLKFDGDDQLSALSDSISEVCSENVQLRRRIETLKNERQSGQ